MLAKNIRAMTWLCMCPESENTSTRKRAAHFIFTMMIFSIIFTGFVANCTYICKFLMVDIEGSLLSIMVSSGLGGLVYSLVTAIIMRFKIRSFYKHLSTIYDAGGNFLYIFL